VERVNEEERFDSMQVVLQYLELSPLVSVFAEYGLVDCEVVERLESLDFEHQEHLELDRDDPQQDDLECQSLKLDWH
jgi:hypothetical protein